jgi:hypothetical protein
MAAGRSPSVKSRRRQMSTRYPHIMAGWLRGRQPITTGPSDTYGPRRRSDRAPNRPTLRGPANVRAPFQDRSCCLSPDTACTCDRGPSLVGELDQACLRSGSAADRSGTVRAATGAEGWRRGRWCPKRNLGRTALSIAAASRSAAIRRRIEKGRSLSQADRLGALLVAHSADPSVGTDYVIDPACDLQLPQQLPPGPTVGAPQLQAPPDA